MFFIDYPHVLDHQNQTEFTTPPEVPNSSQIGQYVTQIQGSYSNAYPYQSQSNQVPQVYKPFQQSPYLSSSEVSNPNQKNQIVDTNTITQDKAWETYYTPSNLNKPLSVNEEIAPHSSTTASFYSNENIIGLPHPSRIDAKYKKRKAVETTDDEKSSLSNIANSTSRKKQNTTNLNIDSRLLEILQSMNQNIINEDLSKEQIDTLKEESINIFRKDFPNKMFLNGKSVNVTTDNVRLMKNHLENMNSKQKLALITAYILSVMDEEKISLEEFISRESRKRMSLFKDNDKEISDDDFNKLKNPITKNICKFITNKNSWRSSEIKNHPNNDNNQFKNIFIKNSSLSRSGIKTLTKFVAEEYKEKIRKKWNPCKLYKIIFKHLHGSNPNFSLQHLLIKPYKDRFLNLRNLESILYLLNKEKIATFPKGCKVLDPYGKFGEGAVGALANEQITHYFCNVSNKEIKSSIQKIQNKFGDKTKPNKITCISKKAEELLRENFNYPGFEGLVDIVFTRLDFQNFEYFPLKKDLSINSKITKWTNELLKPSLLQWDKKLKPNGFFIISTNEFETLTKNIIKDPAIESRSNSGKSKTYIEVSKIFNTEMTEMNYKYIGCIGLAGKKSVPIWIWQKKETQEGSTNNS